MPLLDIMVIAVGVGTLIAAIILVVGIVSHFSNIKMCYNAAYKGLSRANDNFSRNMKEENRLIQEIRDDLVKQTENTFNFRIDCSIASIISGFFHLLGEEIKKGLVNAGVAIVNGITNGHFCGTTLYYITNQTDANGEHQYYVKCGVGEQYKWYVADLNIDEETKADSKANHRDTAKSDNIRHDLRAWKTDTGYDLYYPTN